MALEKHEKKHCEVSHYRPYTRFAIEKKQEMREFQNVLLHPSVSQGLFPNTEGTGRGFLTLSGLPPHLLQMLDILSIILKWNS